MTEAPHVAVEMIVEAGELRSAMPPPRPTEDNILFWAREMTAAGEQKAMLMERVVAPAFATLLSAASRAELGDPKGYKLTFTIEPHAE